MVNILFDNPIIQRSLQCYNPKQGFQQQMGLLFGFSRLQQMSRISLFQNFLSLPYIEPFHSNWVLYQFLQPTNHCQQTMYWKYRQIKKEEYNVHYSTKKPYTYTYVLFGSQPASTQKILTLHKISSFLPSCTLFQKLFNTHTFLQFFPLFGSQASLPIFSI